MTKHNLKDHLTWLLQRGPVAPPALEYTLVPVNANRAEPDVGVLSNHNSSPGVSVNSPSPDAPPINVPTRHLPTQDLENGRAGSNATEMARLQLAPHSASRPRMLTQFSKVPAVPPHTLPTPSASRSPFYRSIAHSSSSQDQTSIAAPCERQADSAPPKTHATGYEDIVFDDGSDILDIDEIDLTGEVDDNTASSFEGFGEPKQLWTEGAASRKEPLSQKGRGKKRKSDEYQSDQLSSRPGRRSHEPNQKSGRILEEGLQTGSQLGARNSAQKPAPKRARKSAVRPSPYRVDETLRDDMVGPLRGSVPGERLSVTERHIRTEPRRSRSPTQVPLFQDRDSTSDATITPKRHVPSQCKTTSNPRERSSKRSVKDVVPDSEDEEGQEPKAENESSPIRNMDYQFDPQEPDPSVSALAKTSTPVTFRDVENRSHSKGRLPNKPTPQAGSRTRQNDQRFSSASKPKKESPLSMSTMGSLAASSAGLSSSSQLSQRDKALVSLCMNWQEKDSRRYINHLRESKQEVDSTIATLFVDGHEVPLDLRHRSKNLKTRISAMEQLIQHRSSYVMSVQRKAEIKSKLVELLTAGHEIDQRESELAKEIKSLNDGISGIEAKTLALIHEADISCQLNRDTAEMPDARGTMPGNILIASTPKPQQMAGNTRRSISPRDRTPSQPHSVSQTPPGRSRLRERSQVSKVLRASTPPPNPTNATTYFSPTRRSPVKDFSPRDRDFGPSRDHSYSRRMGSPLQPITTVDDYDDGGNDDEAMLNMAEALESSWPSPSPRKNRSVPERPVFAETSGNIQKTARVNSQPESTQQAALKRYPWSRDVKAAMRERFHLHGFRHNQLEAINATLAGKDAFVLMPTGGGKSLCYQLPSIVQSGETKGVTIVISPLLSLMQDQVDHLQRFKIQAFLINSEVSAEHRRSVLDALQEPCVEQFIQLLYVTPEMLSKSQAIINAFHKLHKRKKLARIVIDEAHCVSQWGHDFRPDYKALGEVRKQFQGVPVMALTATATENVKVDVIHNLGMDGCDVFSQSFNRPNLTYEVRPKTKGKDLLESIANTIKTFYKGQSGIIYCLSRKNCENIAKHLCEGYKIKARHYHAGMEPQDRITVQKQWQAGKYQVIVATIAFGMGIDKPDVRFVIHHTIPKSLEGYYQETGRAGRDGKRSGCSLYYGYGDTSQLKRMINDGEGSWEQKERQKQMLRNVVQFCENRSDCRRVQVLAYFNEHFSREYCNNSCDNCRTGTTFETHDFTEHAKSAVKLVHRLQRDDVTLLHCVDVYRGSKSKKITDAGHDTIEEHGRGSNLERGDVERLFYRLLGEDALEEVNRVNKAGFASQYVRLGSKYQDFRAGRRSLKIQVRVSPNGKGHSKEKPAKKRSGTGVGAADDDYPASTNVSSPVQARFGRRLVRRAPAQTPLESSDESDGDLVAFEPVRQVGVPRPSNGTELGPSISGDDRLARLNPTHLHVLNDFMENAKRRGNEIVMMKQLRKPPFPDTALREMAIEFPQNKAELLKIEGIDPDKVDRYGKDFLKLIGEAHNNYEAMMRAQEDRPDDPNHRNVVEISDDEDGEEALAQFPQEFSDDPYSDAETSQYFQASDPGVENFNAQMSQIQNMKDSSTGPDPFKKPTARPSRSGSGSGSFRGRRGSGRGGGSDRNKWNGKSKGAVVKKKCSVARSTKASSMSRTVYGANRGGGSARGSGHGGGCGIGLMPT